MAATSSPIYGPARGGDAGVRLDVVSAAILRAKLEAVVADMASTLANLGRSARLSTAHEFSCAILDADGELVTIDNPLHLPSAIASAQGCLDYYQFSIAADDVIVTNDPYSGGTTLHYFTVLAPLGYADDIVGYLVVQAHVIDIGGVVMGNYHPGAIELWAEGVRFTPLKLVVDGKTRRDAMDTLVLNSRDPEGFRGDLDAVLATAGIGRRRLLELIADSGLDAVAAGMRSSLEYSERRFRAELARVPDGSYAGEARLDHDGQGREDLAVRVELHKDGDDVRLDFAGTDEQSTGFVNSTPANTRAYALLPLLGLLDGTVPINSGLLRPVELVTRPGTLVDPSFPQPTGWSREHVGFEIAEAVRVALAAALPEEPGLGYVNRSLVQTVAKDVRVGDVEEQLGVTDFGAIAQSGSTALPDGDGWGQPGPASRGLLPSIEEFEATTPATVVRLEYRQDSAGAGRWRGSPGTETVIRFPKGSLERLNACVVGARHTAPGYGGGEGGGAAAVSVTRGGETTDVATVLLDEPLAAGADLTIHAGGGGGWGTPRERAVDRVAADVADGYVSAEAARSLYGVVIDPATLEVDQEATRRERGGQSGKNEGGA